MATTIHPKHTHKRNAREHQRIAARYQPSAREVFAIRNAARIAEEAIK